MGDVTLTYEDVLKRQKNNLANEISWWPDYLYHFTDVHNVVSILYNGWIYSRSQATANHTMVNDNASRAVIEATRNDNKGYARLYFRPLTPTQFHNEGYKPVEVRKSDINASCPIPVFLCLGVNETLQLPGTKFAERGISGLHNDIKEGLEEFKKLEFSKIYHDGWFGPEDREIIEYRHSEVIREGGFPIGLLLKWIICRTQAEKETLLFLLRQCSTRLYNTYKDRILYEPRLRCFYNNGIFIKAVDIIDNVLIVSFNDSEQRYKNEDIKQVQVLVKIEVAYKTADGAVVEVENGYAGFDYYTIRSCNMNLKYSGQYERIRVKVELNDISMYENEIDTRNRLF